MTRHLSLREASFRERVELGAHEARWLHTQGVAQVTPGSEPGTYDLQVGHLVGTVAIGDLQVSVAPKLPVRTVMWLLAQSELDVIWRKDEAKLDALDLIDVLAHLYIRELDELLRRGLLSGYRTLETVETVLRGRLRLTYQLSRRFGTLYPLEVEYDEFDQNTLENRILLTAALRLQTVLLRKNSELATRLSQRVSAFGAVEALIPGEVRTDDPLTRLNEHYGDALLLARLILEGLGFSEESGDYTAKGILFPMWRVFEKFVARVLKRHLDGPLVNAQYSMRFLSDGPATFQVRPDIVISEGPTITSVVDTKYKVASPTSADLYQMNAYSSALSAPSVTLLYAEPVAERTMTVAGSAARIHIRGVDLTAEPDSIVGDVLSACAPARPPKTK